MTHPIYIVDGSGYIFRAYYAVSSLSTPDGFPTNALYGFTRMLLKLLQQAGSDHVAVTFDMGRETFRLDMYPEYKANRSACPEDLVPQMPYFRMISEALGLPVLELKGYEADDVIGTVTSCLKGSGNQVVIVSGDKDLMQLVGPEVSIWDTMHDRTFGPTEVKEKFGVGPEKVVEVLGLMGDSSDNIPGLDGVGPKTATQLIEKFGSVEGVLSSIEAIKNDSSLRNRKKIAEALESQAETLRLSRKLVEICLTAPVQIALDDQMVQVTALSHDGLLRALTRTPPKEQLLTQVFEKLNFTSLLAELKLTGGAIAQPAEPSKEAKAEYRTIYRSGFAEWLRRFGAEEKFAFDTETTSIDTLSAKIVGASFCWSDEEAFYIPLAHEQSDEPLVTLPDFIAGVKKILEDPAIGKVGQNLKYDVQIFAGLGISVQGVTFDTMVAGYLLQPDKGGYNLTALAEEYLGRSMLKDGRVIEFEEVLAGAELFSQVPVAAAARYACQDAHYAWLLEGKLAPLLDKQGLREVFSEVEVPLVPILARMERQGILLDCKLLAGMSEEFGGKIEKLRTHIFEYSGGEFNLNSPKQLAEVLFEKLAIPTKGLKRTKTGTSTDSSVLEKLSLIHPLPGLLLEYRAIHKLKSTYVDALPAQVSAVTGRLHTRFNQVVTGTGRLSSSDPNLQNIPIQSPEGARIREAFITDPGWVLISADYSQIELRLLAHMSGDEAFIRAFVDDVDIHAQTARELLQLGEHAEVTTEQRRLGKTMNFGIIYGMSGFRLARELGISFGDAELYIKRYFDRFPGIRVLFDEIATQGEREGFVRTLLGRKRILADIDREGRDKGFVNRVAINAPIQGSAADVIKKAMISVDTAINKKGLPLRLLLQIHDELVLECKADILEEATALIRKEMEGAFALKVPLKVEIGSGKNWHSAH
jgi:DNA polymerase-1